MSRSPRSLLVVAGEASGDRIASDVLAALRQDQVLAFGLGGRGCRREGMRTLADVSDIGAMGTLDVLGRMSALGRALGSLGTEMLLDKPRAALLVNFSELNGHLGRILRRWGVPVLWVVAPQVWAWRAKRLQTLHASVDKLAVILPFEEALWRGAGYDATFVGHPSFDTKKLDRIDARRRLGIKEHRRAVVVLAGSRPGEIERMAGPLTNAAAMLIASGDVDEARVLQAPWLDERGRRTLGQAAARARIEISEADEESGATPLLSAFDLALSTSGTACLEATLAGLPTVVGYRVDALTYALGKQLIRTPFIALPNILLGRRAFPELLQDDATADAFAKAGRTLLAPDAKERALSATRTLQTMLTPKEPGNFGERTARLLRPWLDAHAV